MSYLQRFGIKLPPFSSSPDPKFLHRLPQYKRALDKCEHAIEEGRGLVLVHGPIGMGKTTLSRTLFNTYHKSQGHNVASLIRSNYDSEIELLAAIAGGFGIDVDDINDKSLLYSSIEDFLIASKKGKKHAILLLDDVQLLPPELYEPLRILLNFEHDSYKLLQIMLFAQQEVREVLQQVAAFEDRISSYVPLSPLNLADTDELLEYRWNIAGGGSEHPFEPSAIDAIFAYSGGRPRQICALANESLQNAYHDGSTLVKRPHVDLTAQEWGLPGVALPESNDQPISLDDADDVEVEIPVEQEENSAPELVI